MNVWAGRTSWSPELAWVGYNNAEKGVNAHLNAKADEGPE
jgi:hypothetical protein